MWLLLWLLGRLVGGGRGLGGGGVCRFSLLLLLGLWERSGDSGGGCFGLVQCVEEGTKGLILVFGVWLLVCADV